MGEAIRLTWLLAALWVGAEAGPGRCGGCDPCMAVFRSAPIAKGEIPAIEAFRGPWPKSTRPLEAGFDRACRIGDRAEVVAMCPSGKVWPIVSAAPVVATDPEGFTVVMVSRQDHERLAPWAEAVLYYARCRPKSE